jgi:glycosyltransferase involved in cell wall biosynthesis
MRAHGIIGRHLAVVTAGLGAGGAERVIADISARWISCGVKVTIISFDSPGDRIYHALPEGVVVLQLGIPAHRRTAGVISRIRRLRASLHTLKPDVVISFLTKINVLTLVATIGMTVPVVVAERNNPERQDAHLFWRLTSYIAHLRANMIICQTSDSKRCVPYHARNRVRVIPNPISAARFRPRKTPRLVLVAVGRLTPQKGFDLLVDAFAQISNHHCAWELHIWGEGPERKALQARIDHVGLKSRILLRGLSEQPGGWLVEANAFVLSSRYEGFPNVLGEALAAGLPSIGTDCDFGPADLIVHGENGLLVAPNSVPALAAGLNLLLGDPRLRSQFHARGPEVIDRYAPERIFEAWNDVLASLLPDTGRTPPAYQVKAA